MKPAASLRASTSPAPSAPGVETPTPTAAANKPGAPGCIAGRKSAVAGAGVGTRSSGSVHYFQPRSPHPMAAEEDRFVNQLCVQDVAQGSTPVSSARPRVEKRPRARCEVPDHWPESVFRFLADRLSTTPSPSPPVCGILGPRQRVWQSITSLAFLVALRGEAEWPISQGALGRAPPLLVLLIHA